MFTFNIKRKLYFFKFISYGFYHVPVNEGLICHFLLQFWSDYIFKKKNLITFFFPIICFACSIWSDVQ